MIFKRFYNESLAQASYLVGCGVTGEAIIIDPNRDASQYVQAAESEGLHITAVTETHIHADYLSGLRELSAKTGAKMYLSDEGPDDWKYEFTNDPYAKLIKDGSVIQIGNIRLDVIATPGHTPEHISFILTDEPASEKALGAFTGDFVFVGDVGRPDLLERAANIKGTMEVGGKQLFNSIQKFAQREDGLLIWPGHGAGSACGKNLGGAPVSSLGYEKAANWAFKTNTESLFVDEVLSGQPEPPYYFAMMKKLNKKGPAILREFLKPRHLDGSIISRLIGDSAQVLDVRNLEDVAKGYIGGTINVPLDKEFVTWAGWFLKYDKDIFLIALNEKQATDATRELAMIGLDRVEGWFDTSAFTSFKDQGGRISTITDAPFNTNTISACTVLDVRSSRERANGFVPGSIHIPLGYLSDRVKELPQGKKFAVHCGGGVRSHMAITVLRSLGIGNCCNLAGGFYEYKGSGLPVQVGDKEPEPAGK